ncbi:MAG: glycan-binding surface protein [Mangrovibacterium sp.]
MMNMNTTHKIKTFFYLIILMAGFLFTACDDDDEGGALTMLNSWGPSPALRGGELKFIGSNLDKVSTIVLPDNVEVTTFVTKTSELLVIEVPEETVNGKVVLKTPDGNITTKTTLVISEPITITSFSPAKLRPGESVTINGTYLNLIKEVIFADKKSVTTFESQNKDKLIVKVPMDAQSGTIVISNGAAEPILVESENLLDVNLPAATAMTPVPVKAGTALTLTGTDLDLVKSVLFPGGIRVETFTSQEAGAINLDVPANAQAGKLVLSALSGVEVEVSTELELVAPTITEVAPVPAKNGGEITITGTDLDLVTGIVFGGDKSGQIVSKTTTELVAKVPMDAVDGVVTLNTAAGTSVTTSQPLTLVVPTIVTFSPTETKTNNEITITGTNLDLVTTVVFAVDLSVQVSNGTETSITVNVPSGTQTGTFNLLTTNGGTVTSASELTILPSNIPVVTSMPESVKPGAILAMEGEKLDLFTDIIFPGGIYATMYGIKSSTYLEVYVPLNAQPGTGVLTFVTIDNETTTSPEFVITAAEPVQDWDLVFFDFDGSGAKDSWWGAVSLENDPALSLNGTSYGRLNNTFNGWADLFWRNSSNNFPGATIGTNVADYVLKFDINVLEPITDGNIKFRLQGDEGDFWWAWGPAAPSAGIAEVVEVTNGWITVTVEISDFKDDWGWGTASPTDLSLVNNAFGMAFDNGASNVNFCIDNVRFEHK